MIRAKKRRERNDVYVCVGGGRKRVRECVGERVRESGRKSLTLT